MAKSNTNKPGNDKIATTKSAIPAIFGEAEGPTTPLVDTTSTSPYVQFAHPNAKAYPAIVEACGKTNEGTPILCLNGEYKKLDNFQFLVMPGTPQAPTYIQFMGVSDAEGKVIEAYSMDNAPKNAKEYIEAIILCILKDSIQPARIRFMGAKTAGYKASIARIRKPDGDVWAEDFPGRSKDHKFVSQSHLPRWSWLTHTGSLSRHTPKRKVDEDGNPVKDYYQLDTSSAVSSMVVLKLLRDAMKDETFLADSDACMKDFKNRCDEIANLIGQ